MHGTNIKLASSKCYVCTVDLTKICTFSTAVFIILGVSFFFQAFEQQSASSHSRHAFWQHAQPPSAVSTLFNTYHCSNSCQHVYMCLSESRLPQIADGSLDVTLFLSTGGAAMFFFFYYVENTTEYFYRVCDRCYRLWCLWVPWAALISFPGLPFRSLFLDTTLQTSCRTCHLVLSRLWQ
jgi:hypothetical protein